MTESAPEEERTFDVGARVKLRLDPTLRGEVVEVLEIPGDDLYTVKLDGGGDPIRYSGAVLLPE